MVPVSRSALDSLEAYGGTLASLLCTSKDNSRLQSWVWPYLSCNYYTRAQTSSFLGVLLVIYDCSFTVAIHDMSVLEMSDML